MYYIQSPRACAQQNFDFLRRVRVRWDTFQEQLGAINRVLKQTPRYYLYTRVNPGLPGYPVIPIIPKKRVPGQSVPFL